MEQSALIFGTLRLDSSRHDHFFTDAVLLRNYPWAGLGIYHDRPKDSTESLFRIREMPTSPQLVGYVSHASDQVVLALKTKIHLVGWECKGPGA